MNLCFNQFTLKENQMKMKIMMKSKRSSMKTLKAIIHHIKRSVWFVMIKEKELLPFNHVAMQKAVRHVPSKLLMNPKFVQCVEAK